MAASAAPLLSPNGRYPFEEPLEYTELDHMVLVKSCFQEALRLYHGAFTTREAREDFVFDPKKPRQPKYLIEKGTRVMAFAAVIHHDGNV